MKVISFFSGEGGFELAGEWMGWEVITSCEINPFGSTILKYYWPDAYHHDDVKTINYDTIRARINPGESTIFTAGFPCQPFSTAGKRKGTEDDRYGWPDCLRAIREIRPSWALLENVRGLVSWDGGLVFDTVQSDLEAEGYEVLPFLLPACGVNAPHRRERIWFVAHAIGTGAGSITGTFGDEGRRTGESGGTGLRQTHGTVNTSGVNTAGADAERITLNTHNKGERDGLGGFQGTYEEIPQRDHHAKSGNAGEQHDTNSAGLQTPGAEQQTTGVTGGSAQRTVADTESSRVERGRAAGQQESGVPVGERLFGGHDTATNWTIWPTQSPLCSRNDGLSPKLDGITFPKWRNESIKAHGNAVVPQLVYRIFEAIDAYEMIYD